MGQAFPRDAPEFVESGREVVFFANVAPKIEALPDGNFLVCFGVERKDIIEGAANMIASPEALARIGRQLLELSGKAHNALMMRIVAGPSH